MLDVEYTFMSESKTSASNWKMIRDGKVRSALGEGNFHFGPICCHIKGVRKKKNPWKTIILANKQLFLQIWLILIKSLLQNYLLINKLVTYSTVYKAITFIVHINHFRSCWVWENLSNTNDMTILVHVLPIF